MLCVLCWSSKISLSFFKAVWCTNYKGCPLDVSELNRQSKSPKSARSLSVESLQKKWNSKLFKFLYSELERPPDLLKRITLLLYKHSRQQPISFRGFQSISKARVFCSLDLEGAALTASQSWNSQTFWSASVRERERERVMIEEQVILYLQSLYSQECGLILWLSSMLHAPSRVLVHSISCGNKLLFKNQSSQTASAEQAWGLKLRGFFLPRWCRFFFVFFPWFARLNPSYKLHACGTPWCDVVLCTTHQKSRKKLRGFGVLMACRQPLHWLESSNHSQIQFSLLCLTS